jgi:hypothetical protein
MDDPITAILEGNLKLAREQLRLMKNGVKFGGIPGLNSTEEELLRWIAELEGSLTRHQQRMSEGK